MDPVSAAGIGLSVISLSLQAFSGCVKGYQLLIEVRNLPKEYHHLRTCLRLEQTRFLNWGQRVGLVEEALTEPSRLLGLNHNILLDVLLEISQAFEACIKVDRKYSPFISDTLARDGKQIGDTEEFRTKALSFWQRSQNVIHRIEWAALNKTAYTDLIQRLIGYNERIEGMLGQSMMNDLYAMQTRSNLATLQLAEHVSQLQELVAALDFSTRKDTTLLELANFKALEIMDDAEPATDSPLRLEPYDVMLADHGHQRVLGTLYGKRVWVEWREPSAQEGKDAAARVGKLASLLNKTKPAAFRAPHCVGYFYADSRFGLVYECRSEFSSLRQEYTRGRLSLNARVKIAITLAGALMSLHAVNWLHKGLRSDNILFLGDGPILSGFDISRPDDPEEQTFMHRSRPEHDIYRHPDLLARPPARSKKSHDIYSFGIVLIEIAMWEPIEVTTGVVVRHSKLPDLQAALQEDVLVKVAERAGDTYAEAVRCCILGGRLLGLEPFDVESHPRVGAAMLSAFHEKVLSPLAGLKL